jgi:hypothetical protein
LLKVSHLSSKGATYQGILLILLIFSFLVEFIVHRRCFLQFLHHIIQFLDRHSVFACWFSHKARVLISAHFLFFNRESLDTFTDSTCSLLKVLKIVSDDWRPNHRWFVKSTLLVQTSVLVVLILNALYSINDVLGCCHCLSERRRNFYYATSWIWIHW